MNDKCKKKKKKVFRKMHLWTKKQKGIPRNCCSILNVGIKLCGWVTVISHYKETFSHIQGAVVKAKHILQRHKTFNYIFELQG